VLSLLGLSLMFSSHTPDISPSEIRGNSTNRRLVASHPFLGVTIPTKHLLTESPFG